MTELATKRAHEETPSHVPEGRWGEEESSSALKGRTIARLRVLWAERRLIYRVCSYALAASLVLAFVLPKRYAASAHLMPPDNQSSSSVALMAALSAKSAGATNLAGDLLGLKGTGALFVGILQSRTVAERLVSQFDLKDVYWESTMQGACEELADRTQISEDRKSGIITLEVTDGDAKRAKELTDAYIAELNHLVAVLSTSAARREREFIEQRLTVVKGELDQAAKEFSEFSSKNTAIDLKEQARAMVEAAATLEGQLIATQSEAEGLKQVYTDNNVRVRAAQARINELRKQLNRLGGTASNTQQAQTSSDTPYPSIRQLPVLGVKYADLLRRTKTQETVLEMLTQQYELAKVQEANEIPTVKVLDAPRVPERKSFPPRFEIIFLGTFFAFAFGAMWILARARWAEIDSQDAGKIFAQEIFTTLKAQTLWPSQNGSRLHGTMGKIWSRLSWRKNQPEVPEEGPK